MNLSLVIPVYNEQENLPFLFEAIQKTMAEVNQSWEAILVDDGSRDKSLSVLKQYADKDPKHIRVISFRRNFGQTAAIAAGLDYAQGEIIILLDADMQNDPADIPMMLAKLNEGYDLVSGWRKVRKDNAVTRNFPSMLANWLISRVTGVHLHDYGCTLKVYRRDVLEGFRLYGEMHRFIPALAHIEGASIVEVPIEDMPRGGGKSHYGLARTGRVLFDILTIRFLLRYLARPLYFFGKIGVTMIVMSGMIATWLLAKKLVWHEDIFIKNGPLLLFSAVTFLGGMQFLGLGFIGDLFARLYYAPEHRTTYNIARIYRSDLPSKNKSSRGQNI